jgi:hypothetical protein
MYGPGFWQSGFGQACPESAGSKRTGRRKKTGSFPGKHSGKSEGGRPLSHLDKKCLLISILITIALGALLYYWRLPAINLKSGGFWQFCVVLLVLLLILYCAAAGIAQTRHEKKRKKGKTQDAEEGDAEPINSAITHRLLTIIGIIAAAGIVIGIAGSGTVFHARRYSRILTVEDGSIDDIPQVSGTDSIALMDTSSAEMLGDREIGSLSGVISQYDVATYTQINYQNTPAKTALLRYAGFFKWLNNRSSGVPGYVMVNPVSMSADYAPLEQGMRYVPSAYFNENLTRRIRFRYPTVMFYNLHFEIDEEQNPWYVASVYDNTVGLFGGRQVTGAILVNPVTGEMEKYDADHIPGWVDSVYPGDLICTQYNYSAQLQNGYWNSVFGQRGCRRVTEAASSSNSDAGSDFGYIAKDGDIWIYTGVTSVNNDSSNIGFILSNQRTEETLFITCSGADEFSGMSAAEGEVQEKRYQASFPSLILVDEMPTYIMVLKDASGLVKMYAAVNVEQYNMVATATTQAECISRYRALMNGNITQEEASDDAGTGTDGTAGSDEESSTEEAADTSAWPEKTITVRRLQTIDRNGDTWLYVVDTDDQIYRAKYEDVISMLLVNEGDTITIRTDGDRFVMKE